MQPHRERDKFRFILAASFTAPLLRILQQRIFFVYNWGGSKGGKTAALKAALSAWGPKQENLEKIVYMIASGTGRARGSKAGGLQTLNTWRTVALATGEEPLSTETTQTGVSTRVLEIYGGPFDDEKSASFMHQQAPQHCGWAGPEFIRRILQTDEQSVRDEYARMTEEVYKLANGTNGAHIAGISAVALADALVESWIFNPDPEAIDAPGAKLPLKIAPEAWERAIKMAETIIREQQAAGTGDVNEHATQFIVDWILSNRAQFGDKAIGTCLGTLSQDGRRAYKVNIFLHYLTRR